ncbi:SagB/ThcOx family dehydrogenase [Sphingomonas sp. RS6]
MLKRSNAAESGNILPLAAASYLNSFKNLATHIKSTGMRTAQLVYTGGPPEQRDAALDFIESTRFRRGDRQFELSVRSYFDDEALVMLSQVGRRSRGTAEILRLGEPLGLPVALDEVIASRRSLRELSGEPLKIDQLATILQSAGGITATATTQLTDGRDCSLPLRAAPSGGGLYPIDLHLAVQSLPGLAPGLYDFLPLENALVRLPCEDGAAAVETIVAALPGDFVDVRLASAFLIFSMTPWRSMRKYGQRGLRFALMEVGYIAENVHLAATALGTPSCDYGGFFDDEIDRVFDFDGLNRTTIHVMVLGG